MTDGPATFNRISSWDMNQDHSPNIHAAQSIQNGPPISSITPARYMIPYARLSSQPTSQFGYNPRQLPQQYQQSPMMGSFQPIDKNVSVQSEKSWCAKHVTVTKVIGLLIGLVAAGIPLAVVTTMYIQLNTSSSDNATASSSSTTISTSIPYQCTTYTIWNDDTRLATYYCPSCGCDNGIANNWYRIQGPLATRLASTPSSYGTCGTYYPVWFNGTLPTNLYQTTVGTACMYYNSDPCYASYSGPIPVTNCGSFYVYYLRSLTAPCFCRYCTAF